jgi:hypothetical protein
MRESAAYNSGTVLPLCEQSENTKSHRRRTLERPLAAYCTKYGVANVFPP